ncbi:MAG: NAD-dependent epimerase/dehydratase family protein [Myxococcales bacterium]|nr:NAD-dependent epimerase/dehydratase family protein [Myxococcales bacterium]
MRVLVTGGCGFIGHHLVSRWAATRPADTLLVLDLLTYAGNASRLPGDAALVVGDVADPAAVRAAFDRLGRVDALVHLAAESHVDRSIIDPARFVLTNVLGTQVLLDTARERGVGRFVHVSTDEVYGSVDVGAADEAAAFRPGSPYAASKAAGELLVHAAHNTWRLPTVVARPANTFGTGQFPEKLLPVLARAAVAGAPLPLYGDGLHQRDWLAVDDLCDALMLLVDRAADGSVWNIPGGGGRTNRSVAEAICGVAGVSLSLITSVADRPGHDRRYAMDGSAIHALGFRASRSLDAALPALVAEARAAVGTR